MKTTTQSRPWGYYQVLFEGSQFKVKVLVIDPGQSISLQYHNDRSENWTIVKGMALVTKGDMKLPLSAGSSVFIPVGVVHRLRNVGSEHLQVIEVQTGKHLSEDDIVRLQDEYGRS